MAIIPKTYIRVIFIETLKKKNVAKSVKCLYETQHYYDSDVSIRITRALLRLERTMNLLCH